MHGLLLPARHGRRRIPGRRGLPLLRGLAVVRGLVAVGEAGGGGAAGAGWQAPGRGGVGGARAERGGGLFRGVRLEVEEGELHLESDHLGSRGAPRRGRALLRAPLRAAREEQRVIYI